MWSVISNKLTLKDKIENKKYIYIDQKGKTMEVKKKNHIQVNSLIWGGIQWNPLFF